MEVRVEATANPQATLSDYRTFAMAASHERDAAAFNLTEHVKATLDKQVGGMFSESDGRYELTNAQTDPATARYVASIARETLSERGLSFDEAAPQFIVSVDFVTGVYREFGHTGMRGVISASSDPNIGIGVGTAAGNVDAYPQEQVRNFHARAVAIYIYDFNEPDRLLWHGHAVTTRTDEPFAKIAPLLIDELLNEFPHPSGKPAKRTIHPPTE